MSWSLSVGPVAKSGFDRAVDDAKADAPDDQKSDPTFPRDLDAAKSCLKKQAALMSDVAPLRGSASGHIPTEGTSSARTIQTNVYESV